MSFSKGVAPMSVHSLLDPSNSESLPEVDLVSTVRMAWLPPQVKYWISNLHRKIKKKKRKKERIVLKNIPPLSSSSSSLLLTVAPRGNFWAARGSYWTGRRDGRGKGWPRSEDSGSSNESPVVCLSIGRHPRAPGSPPRSLPALPIAAQPCDEENKNRDRGRREAKRLTYVFSSPTCNTPLWRWGEARPVNENTTTLMEPSSGQPPSIEPLWFSRSIFTLGKKLLVVIIREIEDERMRFVYLDRPLESTALYSSNTAPGLPSSWNCWIETCIDSRYSWSNVG